jgi:hypothetical protein
MMVHKVWECYLKIIMTFALWVMMDDKLDIDIRESGFEYMVILLKRSSATQPGD